jgi:hypothetical protein
MSVLQDLKDQVKKNKDSQWQHEKQIKERKFKLNAC